MIRKQQDDQGIRIIARELNDQQTDDDEIGFLFYNKNNTWPQDPDDVVKRLPDDWIEERNEQQVIKKNRKKYLPHSITISPNGYIHQKGNKFQFIQAPFKFCLNCGVSYGIRQRSDFAKLSTLSSEGRSTATTILSLSSIRYLQNDSNLEPTARKLLSFTDNRQDASLQAGHFNDFIEIGVLRSGLYQAIVNKGDQGLNHDELTIAVYNALNFAFEYYASKPGAQYLEKTNTEKAFRNVLGYRLYRDLKRGWRITSPNLEQCGLIKIEYSSLSEISKDQNLWNGCNENIVHASPETRHKILKVLLDFMRRELAIQVDYLDSEFQERLQQQSSQHLVAPWAIDENERMIHASVLYPRSRKERDYSGNIFLSARGGFGMYLRRSTTFPDSKDLLYLEDTQTIIIQILDKISETGIIAKVDEPADENSVAGYQLSAASIIWKPGDGTQAFHDPIRVPNQPEQGSRTNPYFLEYYRKYAKSTHTLEAREHTAQVPYDDREHREQKFRKAELPILFCSPTMELGVDIAELNVVNLRNVPPTPANYAQRSGRAGRSGQPAMVFTYCTTGSPHDQYFFKRPGLMVSGNVTPPRMDLANEDLIKAHIHAIWLAETGTSLGKSLKDILDLSGEEPSLELTQYFRDSIESKEAIIRTKNQAEQILQNVQNELKKTDWYHDAWLESVLNNVVASFDRACDRWRNLYWSALAQAKVQSQIILDATKTQKEKSRAERQRHEAEAQLKLLTEVGNVVQSDFYSYRYFASEGFLPGYNFPRLPLSAYIPGRRTKQKDEFLSRPRFLAISEFGPRSFIYHEGSQYVIHKVILPVHDETLNTGTAKICCECGYLHPVSDGVGVDLCELCGSPLDNPMNRLFRLQNVSTKRRDRITSDEEERMRLGYDLLTGVRFNGNNPHLYGWIESENTRTATLRYGHTATIWRINLGWKRRKIRSQLGFMLDTEQGLWERNETTSTDDDDVFSRRIERVIPFVEDRRNSLIIEPTQQLDMGQMASLQSALKAAIQIEFQLEDQELAVEPLPDYNSRKSILIYESAEGGAGVLRRLLFAPQEFKAVARRALELCHFDPATGEDLKRAPFADEDCEAACYNCLMNYGNQPDHEHLDRHKIKNILLQYANSTVHLSPVNQTREQHFKNLLKLCDSELEKNWLRILEKNEMRLPSEAQPLIHTCETRPDFLYKENQVAVYIDGPYHDYPERQQRDHEKTECMEDYGYTVIRFGHQQEWLKQIERYPNIFGSHE
ncbi:MAG: Zn-binding domain-containing protein [candidate division KSB1 bacterium]|nr:Zn-binding domain-containing protein [candidate division KSB1 bacterium]